MNNNCAYKGIISENECIQIVKCNKFIDLCNKLYYNLSYMKVFEEK